MSFINPEKVPVKVYRWDDTDAPSLDRSAGCVSTIFKACLVTGYGDKQPVGWSMPYEDTDAGIKVFRPPETPEQDFYMRLSDDTGRRMRVQVYFDMTDANTGDLKLECATPFKYGVANPTGKWIMIATERGFWFFCETSNDNDIPTNQSGSYLYCGDTGKNTQGFRGLYLKHTGGTWGDTDDDRYAFMSTIENETGSTVGRLFDTRNFDVLDVDPISFFDGLSNQTTHTLLSQILIMAQGDIWTLPAFAPSRNDKLNYEKIDLENNKMINHGTSSYYNISNIYIPTDFWEL